MDVYIEPLFDRPQKVGIIIDVEFRMKSSLYQYLRAAQVERLLYLPKKDVPVDYIGVLILLVPPECAEGAFVDADIGVVDVPVDDECDGIVGMEPLSHGVCRKAEVRGGLSP